MELFIENVRSFEGPNRIPFRPLTLVVGENSSGKTTVLAMLHAALSVGFPYSRLLFNTPPFELGTYDTIATYRGGKYGRAKTFSVGYTDPARNQPFRVEATYQPRQGQPHLSRVILQLGDGKLDARIEVDKVSGVISLGPNDPNWQSHKFEHPIPSDVDVALLQPLLTTAIVRSIQASNSKFDPDVLSKALNLTTGFIRTESHALAIAPVRTKPHRTYDEITDDFKPEGDHVPLTLARMPSDSGAARAQRIWSALDAFGKDSGLFSKLEVKKLGQRPSDPFQIRVRNAGPWVNLADVGYGVSQSLPIVVESVLVPRGKSLLLQQPEVHLHPKAQAALGTLFARLANEEGKRFVIETHSDYLVDRIRIEVAAGTIPHQKVLLLFLERHGLDTRVHTIDLDDKGNIKNPPPSFRAFFLNEETRLLTRGK